MEPSRGLEPRTCRLQDGCSACLSYDGITMRQGALFCVLGLIPPVGNFAKIHARGGGGLQPEDCRDQSPPPQAQTSPEQSAKTVGGGRDRPGGGTPFAGARRGAGAGGSVRARALPARGGGRLGLGGAGTAARHGRGGGLFAGAGNRAADARLAAARAPFGAAGWRGRHTGGAGRGGGAARRELLAATISAACVGFLPTTRRWRAGAARFFSESRAAKRRRFGAARGAGRRRGRVSSYMRA